MVQNGSHRLFHRRKPYGMNRKASAAVMVAPTRATPRRSHPSTNGPNTRISTSSATPRKQPMMPQRPPR